MRLLRLDAADEFSLVEFVGRNIPRYAILSHTWGADEEEVTFKDFSEGIAKTKLGYEKITFCGQQTAKHGLRYFWIDTCCIDKSSSTELSEAINSMFKWYKLAKICFAYLADVSIDQEIGPISPAEDPWSSAVPRSRWFTRGWTLQELLAPADVYFFSSVGVMIGTKSSRVRELHRITGIDAKALTGGPLEIYSEETIISWAHGRATKREEDSAYCLLGIFDVHMPLIYGEGERKAFVRLRREIRDSQSAWRYFNIRGNLERMKGILGKPKVTTKGGSKGGIVPDLEPMPSGDRSKSRDDSQDPSTVEVIRRKPLMIAANAGQLEVVRLLLNRGISPNATDSDGKTPLQFAAERGHVAVINLLLDNGADLNARDECGRTALCQAAFGDCAISVKLLLGKGCHVKGSEPFWVTPLHDAADSGSPETAELLLENDSSLLDMATKKGMTPLYIAAAYGRIDMVKFLIHKGCDKDRATRCGWTALMVAADKGHVAIVELLLYEGCNTDKAIGDGRTALEIAVAKGHIAVVELLL